MKKLLTYLLVCSLICHFSCGLEELIDDSPCGPTTTFDLYLLGSSIVDETTGVFSSYMEGTNRVFQWSEFVDNVCTEEHIKSTFRVGLLDETTTGISARARVTYQALFESKFTMTKDGSDLKGGGETGIKGAFPDLNGSISPVLEVFFPTKGDYDLDIEFLKDNVISVEIKSTYRIYKP